MVATREVIIPTGMEILYEKYHYCPGIRIGNTVYVSGQVGRDENLQVVEGIEAQFIQAFENVKKVLLTAGVTFDDVVEMVTYHVTTPASASGSQPLMIPHLSLFMEIKDRYFMHQYPTWTKVGVIALSDPRLIVEIKCTALR
ncbi:MAG: RidA family protein [Coleofasciculus sp. C1-SOL-03]|jgi:enamine deaminase RidA (YjgF/YER057c/UK114 family)|uniref:RidA family protein n=1 Tax=Coleofasciculus sp. C1-SOL-03 TaxID=3069522 RepID=UPI0032FE8399